MWGYEKQTIIKKMSPIKITKPGDGPIVQQIKGKYDYRLVYKYFREGIVYRVQRKKSDNPRGDWVFVKELSHMKGTEKEIFNEPLDFKTRAEAILYINSERKKDMDRAKEEAWVIAETHPAEVGSVTYYEYCGDEVL